MGRLKCRGKYDHTINIFFLSNLMTIMTIGMTLGLNCIKGPCMHGICLDDENSLQHSCYCVDGYTGINCEINWDDCWSNPCLNGATCNDLVAGYNCTCTEDFVGTNCEKQYSECMNDPCLNNGTCLDTNGFVCQCLEGYSGEYCEIDATVCNDTICENSGECIEGPGLSFSCACSEGWTGTFCEEDVNECLGAPCKNGGYCNNVPASYTCVCLFGFTGKDCEKVISPCEINICDNGAICMVEDNEPTCYCVPDYHGHFCELRYDDCESKFADCKNGGTCIDGINSFTCSCPSYYVGNTCEEYHEYTTFLSTETEGPVDFGTSTMTINYSTSSSHDPQPSPPSVSSKPESWEWTTIVTESSSIFDNINSTYLILGEQETTISNPTQYINETESNIFSIPQPDTYSSTITGTPLNLSDSETFSTPIIEISNDPSVSTSHNVPIESKTPHYENEFIQTTSATVTNKEFMYETESYRKSTKPSLELTSEPSETLSFSFETSTHPITILYGLFNNRSSTTTPIPSVILGTENDLDKTTPSVFETSTEIYPSANSLTTKATTCECSPKEDCSFDNPSIKYAAFNGKSYIKQRIDVKITEDNNDATVEIFIVLKTLSTNGIILHVYFDDDKYALLYLDSSSLKFQFSCGLQTMLLGEIDSTIDNGYETNIEIRFQYFRHQGINKCSTKLLVNDTLGVSGEQILTSQENLPRYANLHLGGIPLAFSHYFPHVAMGFVGCMNSLKVNKALRDFIQDSIEIFQIEECTSFLCLSNPCQNFGSCEERNGVIRCRCIAGFTGALCERSICDENPCQLGSTCISSPGTGFICVCPLGNHGLLCEEDTTVVRPSFSVLMPGFSSYIAYGISTSIKDSMELKLRVIPRSLEQISLIAYFGQSGSRRDLSDHLSITYVRGYIMLTWDLGSGVRRIFTSVPLTQSSTKISSSKTHNPHTIRVGRKGRDAWLSVDGIGNVTGRAAGSMTQLDVSPILYIGGHKSRNFEVLPHDLPLHTGFAGCIFDVELRTQDSVLPVTGTSPATGRGVGECYRNECIHHSCKNGAVCLNQGPTYSCICTKDWTGVDCSTQADIPLPARTTLCKSMASE